MKGLSLFYGLSRQYIAKFPDRPIEFVVDDPVIVFPGETELFGRPTEPFLHFFFVFRPSTDQPFPEHVGVFRFDKKRDRFRKSGPDLSCSLDVDFKDDPISLLQLFENMPFQSSVPIAAVEHFEAFEKLVVFPLRLKFFPRNKPVLNAVDLACTRFSGRRRNAQSERQRRFLENPFQNRSLADSGRAGHDNKPTG